MRVQFNGRTLAFQARYVGSIPITRFYESGIYNYILYLTIYACPQLSWIEQRPSKPWVGGSNPFRHVSDGSDLWWVWRSWLARQIVALEAEGSNPSTHLVVPFLIYIYGGIAQLARAHGSYPWCREFKSPFRYQRVLGNTSSCVSGDFCSFIGKGLKVRVS